MMPSPPFRSLDAAGAWLKDGETLVEAHGTRVRACMRCADGAVRFCEADAPPGRVKTFKDLVEVIAQCVYDLRRRDFEII